MATEVLNYLWLGQSISLKMQVRGTIVFKHRMGQGPKGSAILRVFVGSHNVNLEVQKNKQVLTKRTMPSGKQILNKVRGLSQKEGARI